MSEQAGKEDLLGHIRGVDVPEDDLDEDLDDEDGDGLIDRLDAETNVVLDALLSHASRVRPDQKLSRKVADRADAIAHELGMAEPDRSIIRKAAVLRDIGKVGLSEQILNKKGPLTPAELAEVRSRITPDDDTDDSEAVRAGVEIAQHHRERFDGSGYPDGLKGDAIPLGSRILAVAEAYETMLIATAYRPARDPEKASAEISAGASSLYDPAVAEALARTVASGKPGPHARRINSNRPDYWGKEKVEEPA
ncbi:MAG: HD domain-containing protein [Armatimonadota bacterium]|nr:HD domain-containing protein [Armatimonadota bacterium]